MQERALSANIVPSDWNNILDWWTMQASTLHRELDIWAPSNSYHIQYPQCQIARMKAGNNSFLATSLRSNKEITLPVPRIKTNADAKAFRSCTPSLWNSLPLAVCSAPSVASVKRRHNTYLFDLILILPLYTHRRPVDVTVEFIALLLLRHWAWLRRGYWRYRNLIVWLIDWLIEKIRDFDPFALSQLKKLSPYLFSGH